MSDTTSAMSEDERWSERLEYARDIVRHIEAGNYDDAELVMDELTDVRNNEMYQQIGKLTRDLHEKINSFVDESRILEIAHRDIPDARDRLSYVINLTEESAHNTMASVENSMPVIDALGARSAAIKEQWQVFIKDKKGVDTLRGLIDELDGFLQQVIDDTANIHNELFDVLMAQGFQDLTGQVIQRVIDLVHELEQSLLGIIHASGHQLDSKTQNNKDKDGDSEGKNNSGHGPAIPGVTGGDVVSGQDDVDDLLSTLGF